MHTTCNHKISGFRRSSSSEIQIFAPRQQNNQVKNIDNDNPLTEVVQISD